jgi:hypothetical protein
MLRAARPTAFPQNLPVMKKDVLVPCVFTAVRYLTAKPASAVYAM